MRRILVAVAVVAVSNVGLVGLASAQPPMPPPGGSGGPGDRGGMGPMGPPMLMGVEPGPMNRVVKGAPFSADAVTEMSQTLADGNVVARTFKTTIARDGDGRVRTDQTIALMGPLTLAGDAPRMVTITDPVAGVLVMLDDRRKVALRRPLTPPPPPDGARPRGPRPDGPPGPPPGATEEKLGVKTIAGLEADGTRLSVTIPAGAIGNAKPILLVTERWVSTALGIPVRIVRRDPRMGDSVYELTNVVRGEPGADLFEVPSGYTVQDDTRAPGGPGRGPRPPGDEQ